MLNWEVEYTVMYQEDGTSFITITSISFWESVRV